MAAVARRPLYPRVDIPVAPSAMAANSPATTMARRALGGIANLKRPRSPEPHATRAVGEASLKRSKASAPAKEKEKETTERAREKRSTRAAQDDEFKAKYTKAFPSWSFYFDVSDHEISDLEQRVAALGGVRRLNLVSLVRSDVPPSKSPTSSRTKLPILSLTNPYQRRKAIRTRRTWRPRRKPFSKVPSSSRARVGDRTCYRADISSFL